MVLSPRSQQALLSLPAFRGLAETDRKAVAERVCEIALEKGEIVYRAGDEADALYLVVTGAVDVLDGERLVTRYGHGEVFGEAVLVPGERRATTTRVYPQAQNPLEVVLRAIQRVNPMAFGNPTHLPNSFDVVVRTLQIMQHELGNVRSGEADLLIAPDLREYWVLEFWRAAELIELGRRAAETQLPAIRSKLDALGARTV